MSDPRIVSLLPSATEIVAALGFADRLVGRSHECDYPKAVGRLPVCTTARLDPGLTSAGIDRQVKERLRERAANGADLQIVYMPKGTPAEAGQALEEFISA